MGGGKSSSETNQTTNQYDQRVAVGGDGVAIGAGAVVDATTPEAWAALDDLIGETGDIAAGAWNFGKLSQDLIADNTAKVLEFIETRSQSEETTLAEKAMKIALPIAMAAVAVSAFKKG